MQLKRYCVTVMDHVTPTRTFWTQKGAERWHDSFVSGANLFRWNGDRWVFVPRPDQNGRVWSQDLQKRLPEEFDPMWRQPLASRIL